MAEGMMPDQRRSVAFLRRHLSDIHRDGMAVLWRKAWHVLPALLFLPLVLLIRVLHPWVAIRIGRLPSYRIGIFAANTELYLSQRDAMVNRRRGFDLFFLDGYVCNEQLAKMWCRILRVSRWARYAYICNNLLPGKETHIVPLSAGHDMSGVLEHTQVHLSFTPEEEERGRDELRSLGLSDGAPFVCAHARDSGYLEYALPSEEPGRWRYHDFRDTSIQTYIPAVQHLANLGYFVVRTGVAVEESVNITNPKVIDYAVKGRTDFLDIYLGAKCHFFICDTAGMSQVPLIFRRPVAWINYLPWDLAPSWSSEDLFMPKQMWSVERRQLLTFSEMINSDIGRFNKSEQFAQHGIELVDNTPEEIYSLVLEMEQRLAGTWQATEEDEELQARLWALFPPRYPNRVYRSRIGAEFLRQNRELLD